MSWYDIDNTETKTVPESDETKREYNARIKYDNIVMQSVDSFEEIVESELSDSNSELSKLYAKGQDISRYVIDKKLFELAQHRI